MELGASLPHSQEPTNCPYPSHINPFLCPSHFCQAKFVSFLVRLRIYQHHGINKKIYNMNIIQYKEIYNASRGISYMK